MKFKTYEKYQVRTDFLDPRLSLRFSSIHGPK
nr:unnamed protein product [Callosobruchus chinensis]